MAAIYAAQSFALANNNDNNNLDFLKTSGMITIDQIPPEFRAPPLGKIFAESSMDPFKKARGKRTYKPAALWHEVTSKGGAVEAETARQFVNDFLSGIFTNDVTIADPRARQGLKDLGFETIITLYEKIAADLPQPAQSF